MVGVMKYEHEIILHSSSLALLEGILSFGLNSNISLTVLFCYQTSNNWLSSEHKNMFISHLVITDQSAQMLGTYPFHLTSIELISYVRHPIPNFQLILVFAKHIKFNS